MPQFVGGASHEALPPFQIIHAAALVLVEAKEKTSRLHLYWVGTHPTISGIRQIHWDLVMKRAVFAVEI